MLYKRYGAHGDTDRLNTTNRQTSIKTCTINLLLQYTPRSLPWVPYAAGFTSGSGFVSIIRQSASYMVTHTHTERSYQVPLPRFSLQAPICSCRGRRVVRETPSMGWLALAEPSSPRRRVRSECCFLSCVLQTRMQEADASFLRNVPRSTE